eukprot:2811774-Rhodomonas_salina.2
MHSADPYAIAQEDPLNAFSPSRKHGSIPPKEGSQASGAPRIQGKGQAGTTIAIFSAGPSSYAAAKA